MKRSLTDSLKQFGININNTSEMKSTFEQSLQFNFAFENNFKNTINALVNEVDSLYLLLILLKKR